MEAALVLVWKAEEDPWRLDEDDREGGCFGVACSRHGALGDFLIPL